MPKNIKEGWGHPVFGTLLRVAQQIVLADPTYPVQVPYNTEYYCVFCGAEVGHKKQVEKHKPGCPWVALRVTMRQWQEGD